MSDVAVSQKKRIAWIDIAKGITILTVIWSHSLPFGCLPRNLIFSFHMPLFFILSGFTLKPAKNVKNLIERTKKDFLRLIVPVILATILVSILAIILRDRLFLRKYIILFTNCFGRMAFRLPMGYRQWVCHGS